MRDGPFVIATTDDWEISIKMASSLHVMTSTWKQTRSASDIH